jgi:hypothetical protein
VRPPAGNAIISGGQADKEKTTVRTIHWLKLVRKNEIKNSTL